MLDVIGSNNDLSAALNLLLTDPIKTARPACKGVRIDALELASIGQLFKAMDEEGDSSDDDQDWNGIDKVKPEDYILLYPTHNS